MRAHGHRGHRVAAAVVVAFLGGAVAPAHAAASFAATSGCDEHQAFVEGDDAAVAARLPKRYTAVRAPSGRPLLFVRSLRCRDVAIDASSGPAIMASFGIVVESPDGRGCASGAPVVSTVGGDKPPVCNWYTLAWLANDRRVVDWLRDGTPGFPAVYARDADFTLGKFSADLGGAPFNFHTGTPFPFTMDETARERSGKLAVRGGYWVDTPQGTVKLAFSTHELTSGDATGVVRTARGTAMADLFGATERSYLPGYSSLAAERWEHAAYRKQILAPADNTDSFAGSCSFPGTVRFSPPATNTAQPLTYDYTADGTCTGTLDGSEISNAPVKVHQSGHSEGSCNGAKTTEPGRGTMTFPGGQVVGYTLDFTSTATEVDFDFYGERSGTAAGHGSFLTPRTPPDVAARCGGDGVKETPLDVTLTTDTPLVSEHPATGNGGGGSGPRPPRARPRAHLRMSASPRIVRSGRRTSFAFRVTSRGRPVAGALVRFFGHNARTTSAGTATIAAVLHGPGLHPARSSKSGFRSAAAQIRVRG